MTRGVPDILARIVEQRRARLGISSREVSPPAPESSSAAPANAFLSTLEAVRGRAIIAEVKMGSPRLGSLVGKVEPERQARSYAESGAAALSVVVEPDFFHGSYELLAACKAASGLPALAKDFLVSARQLDWAVEAGADAVLLIAALFSSEELRGWADAARARGLVPLVETHDAADVARLDGAEWELVGINNRDLRTFEVDLAHSIELRPSLPEGALAIAESGIASGEDRRRLADAGFDAFLIGEALLLAEEPGGELGRLLEDSE